MSRWRPTGSAEIGGLNRSLARYFSRSSVQRRLLVAWRLVFVIGQVVRDQSPLVLEAKNEPN
jgi:hypothetical protein